MVEQGNGKIFLTKENLAFAFPLIGLCSIYVRVLRINKQQFLDRIYNEIFFSEVYTWTEMCFVLCCGHMGLFLVLYDSSIIPFDLKLIIIFFFSFFSIYLHILYIYFLIGTKIE
jgi:hypothetical protein